MKLLLWWFCNARALHWHRGGPSIYRRTHTPRAQVSPTYIVHLMARANPEAEAISSSRGYSICLQRYLTLWPIREIRSLRRTPSFAATAAVVAAVGTEEAHVPNRLHLRIISSANFSRLGSCVALTTLYAMLCFVAHVLYFCYFC